MIIKKGIPISEGIGIGKIFVYKKVNNIKKINSIFEEEKIKFEDSLNKNLKKLEQELTTASDLKKEILEMHIQMINDPTLYDNVIEILEKEQCNASYAVYTAGENLANIFKNMEDEYFIERALDIKDISFKIIDEIEGNKSLDDIKEEIILFADELFPSDALNLDKKYVKGIVTSKGGKTSHTAIIAKNEGIPFISFVDISDINTGDMAIISFEEEQVIISPDEDVITDYMSRKQEKENEEIELLQFKGKESISLDKKHIGVFSNISTIKDALKAKENTTDGIGLFRTEFIYSNRSSAPTEDEQYEIYKEVLEIMEGKSVIIRTIDIGGDKNLDYIDIGKEENPFLGMRAIRYCLKEEAIFRTQIRALLRSSEYGDLKIMFPMISSLEELLSAKKIVAEEKEKLNILKDIEIGIMIEIPSAAIMSDILAKHVDFFSIGTNDLIQYTLATDRMNESVSYLYSYYNPAVLRLIRMTAENARKENIHLGICGDMAGDEKIIPYLIALGFNELSVPTSKVLKTRYLLSKYQSTNEELIKMMGEASTEEEVLKILKKFNK